MKYIICDATFLKRNNGVYTIINSETRQIIKGSYGVKEGVKDLMLFYSELKQAGLEPKVATVDGNTQ